MEGEKERGLRAITRPQSETRGGESINQHHLVTHVLPVDRDPQILVSQSQVVFSRRWQGLDVITRRHECLDCLTALFPCSGHNGGRGLSFSRGGKMEGGYKMG